MLNLNSNMVKFLALTLTLLATLLSGVLCGSVRDSDTYMDSVVNQYLRPDVRSIDPKVMPNFNTFFRTSFDVTANYSRGSMTGLTTIKRNGDCVAPYWKNNNSTLHCSLTFDQLALVYDLRGKYGSLPTVTGAVAHGMLRNTDIYVEVTTSQQRNLPYMTQFTVRYPGHSSSSFDNLGPLSFAKDTLSKTFEGNMTSYVVAVLYDDFRRLVANSVSKLTMPFP